MKTTKAIILAGTIVATFFIVARVPLAHAGSSITMSVTVLAAPATTSTAPQSLSATAGNAQASLSWSAPSSNGGSAITQYLVFDKLTASSTFAQVATTSAAQTTSTITSLTNGVSYDFEIFAQNSVGTSSGSNIVSATPITIPGAPTAVSASAGNTQATITFNAPASNGGSAITSYTATSNPGNFSATGTGSPIVVGGLTNGTSYTFTVIATNAAGNSASSSASGSVTPLAIISITSFSASPSTILLGATSTLTWNATGTIATTTITGPSFSFTTTTSTASGSTGVTPNATGTLVYTLTVTNTTSTATSTASITVNAVATTSTPPQSLAATAGDAQVSLSWSAPASNGGSALAQYLVYDRFTGSSTFAQVGTTTASQTTATVVALANGQSYDFEILAQNGVGTSTASNVVSSTPVAAVSNSGGGTVGGSVGVSAGGNNGGGGYVVTPTSTPSLPTSTSSLQAQIVFLQAQLQELLREVAAQNGNGGGNGTSNSPAFIKNLGLWDRGDDVTALQVFLIGQNKGPAAKALKAHGSSKVFGLLTYAALKEYQQAVGIRATGYFGPITRAYINGK